MMSVQLFFLCVFFFNHMYTVILSDSVAVIKDLSGALQQLGSW